MVSVTAVSFRSASNLVLDLHIIVAVAGLRHLYYSKNDSIESQGNGIHSTGVAVGGIDRS
jgi:hypothetical protein